MLVECEVTQEDILKGEQRKCRECPIARAINRVLKKDISCKSFGSNFELYKNHNYDDMIWSTWEAPSVLNSFVQLFDKYPDSVQPFKFKVDIPEEYLNERI